MTDDRKRIEEIRNLNTLGEFYDYGDTVRFLLSQIDKAHEALERIAKMYEDGPAAWGMKKIAREALGEA